MEDVYIRKAKQSLADAHFEELKGHRKNLQKILECYENAGDYWSKTKELQRAESAYYRALKYVSPKQRERIEKKIKDLRIEHRKLLLGLARMKSELEQKFLWFCSILSFLISFSLVSSNLTGNVIGNINLHDSGWIGMCFFLCGLALASLYFKKKKF